jgi:hypothetical protein
LFFYDDCRFNTTGAFTYRNNRENRKFGTSPILGDNIYIELNVPRKLAFNIRLSINRIVHIFDSKPFGFFDEEGFFEDRMVPDDPSWCQKSVACLEEENIEGWSHEVKSVVVILIDFGSLYEGLCTGTLLNISGGYSSVEGPYLLTCSHSVELAPDPYDAVEDWVFLFGYEDSECGINNSNTQWLTSSNSVYGAELLEYEEPYREEPDLVEYEADYLLCQLSEDTYTINNNIDVAYAGWDKSFNDPDLTPMVLNIHHPGSVSKMFCYSTNLTETEVIWDPNPNCPYYLYVYGNDFWEVVWDIGILEDGSSGSPLLNSSHKIIGILNSSANSCTYTTSDCGVIGPNQPSAFGKFSTAWIMGDFAYYLDPYMMNLNSVETFKPNYCGNGICEPWCGETFPDCTDCPDPDWGGGTGGSICWSPISDGFEINGSTADVVTICPNYTNLLLTTIDDECVFSIGLEILESDDSNCEWEESINCWWTGTFIGKKCNCWHWFYYISIFECDNNLNTIGNEYGGWFDRKKTSFALSGISILDEINQLGLDLVPGKYYRLKFATSPWGSGWTEYVKYFYMLPDNMELNGEISNGEHLAFENITLQNATIETEQDVTLTAGNSIDILSNTTIEYGSSFLAEIDPGIILNCAPIQFFNKDLNTLQYKNDEIKLTLGNSDTIPLENAGTFKLYPNPSHGTVTIEGIQGNSEITVYNTFGEQVLFERLFTKSEINLSHFPKGIYLLTIKTGEGVFTEKVVLQ